jgi:hypothetical protein
MKRLPTLGRGRHFGRGEILLALGSGLEEDDRRRALRHFGGGCRVCWRRLEELKDAPVRLDASHDFVARAIGRSLLALRGVYEPPPMTSAIHLYWTPKVARDPAVFARLAVEEARLMWVEGSPEGFRALEDAVKLLAVPRRLAVGRARRHDLAALAHLYLAYPVYRRGRIGVDAMHHVRLAGVYRRRGSGDPELRAIELTIGAWLGGVTGWEPAPGERLLVAEQALLRFLESHPSPGHLAELRVYQGMAAARRGDLMGARRSFGDAAVHMPEPCVYGRFFAAYQLAAVALVTGDEPSLERFRGVAEHLAERLDPAATSAMLARLRAPAPEYGAGSAPATGRPRQA